MDLTHNFVAGENTQNPKEIGWCRLMGMSFLAILAVSVILTVGSLAIIMVYELFGGLMYEYPIPVVFGIVIAVLVCAAKCPLGCRLLF